ncbi:MAG: beta-N-acetylhexosaminidase [Lachnospiraceae bacterium]|nr:beta-N-acetylhexosaminidase [Lachnospiraceae bacterium]
MENKKEFEDRREYRKKRRQRNQIVAYAALFGLIALIAVGAVQGARFLAKDRQETDSDQKSTQSSIDELIGTEEAITPPTAEPEPTEVPKTAEELLEEKIEAVLAAMPLTDKVAGLFIVTPEAITGVDTAVMAGDGTKDALDEYAVGGIIYFKKNMQSEEQLKEMIQNTILCSRYPVFIAVDEEGGSVSRMTAAGLVEAQLSAAEIGAMGDSNKAYQTGIAIGGYLKDYGFNLDFAPVADINNIEGSVMAERSYGSEAAIVSTYVTAMVKGLQEQGVTACLKHFPGLGSTTADTHDGIANIERTAEELRTQELMVFKNGIEAGAQMIMVGHASAESLSGDKTPASMSSTIVTEVLRKELGFEGIIITDAMNMSAISSYYSSEQAAVMALKAGCDMVLMPENFIQAYAGVLNAVTEGTISEERINDSLRRIYRMKYAEEFGVK